MTKILLRTILIITCSLFSSAAGSAQEKAPEQPEEVAKAYVEATRAADWSRCAGLMHPEALQQVRELFAPLVDMAGKSAKDDKEMELVLGVKNQAEFDRLSGTEVFARFLGLLTRVSPELKGVLGSSSFEIVGRVQEHPDLVHIVYRMQINLPGPNLRAAVPFTKLSVLTMRRSEQAWRVELSGDLRGVIQSMAATLAGVLPDEIEESPPPKKKTGVQH
ncbi:MAG TPA: hypothetical protein VJ302_08380 [Blastocatellia bacterium]|nr:hypothetical protein [Blastocatellia bacterium]